MNPGKHQRSKQRGQDLGWKVHQGAHLLFSIHTLRMNYIVTMFLLASCINTLKHLLYFARFCALLTFKIIIQQKPTAKNFAEFHNHFPL